MRALLWLGVRDYVNENMSVITDCVSLVGSVSTLILDLDIADAAPGVTSSLQESLIPFLGNKVQTVDTLRKRQSPKERAFTYVNEWLRGQVALSSPRTLRDWSGLAEISFWIGHRHINSLLLSSVREADLDHVLATLPLQDLGDVVLGLSFTWGERLDTWLSAHHAELLTRFQQETQTIAIQDDQETMHAYFLVNLDKSGGQFANWEVNTNQGTEYFNSEVVQRIDLLRKLYPQRQAYGGQGYGHQLGLLSFPYDPTPRVLRIS